MENVVIAQLAILSGLATVFVAGSIWLDKVRGRKVRPKEHVWLAVTVFAVVLFIVGGTVYAIHFPDSFPSWLYASAGVYGISSVIDIGFWIAVFVVLGSNILKREK